MFLYAFLFLQQFGERKYNKIILGYLLPPPSRHLSGGSGHLFPQARTIVPENFNRLSRCSKLFYMISRCYFHIESTFSGASVSFVFSHIARYVPSPEENSCIPITHFQCKNNFEHLLISANPHRFGHKFVTLRSKWETKRHSPSGWKADHALCFPDFLFARSHLVGPGAASARREWRHISKQEVIPLKNNKLISDNSHHDEGH